jgi:septal ring factor EnvC (AmiA/AmiB activator)
MNFGKYFLLLTLVLCIVIDIAYCVPVADPSKRLKKFGKKIEKVAKRVASKAQQLKKTLGDVKNFQNDVKDIKSFKL